MVVDDHLGIMGNGNQDTQSWYHSMEVNIMIDSREVCQGWMEGIRRNQSQYLPRANGLVSLIVLQIHIYMAPRHKRMESGVIPTGKKLKVP